MIIKGSILGSYGDLWENVISLWDAIGEYRVLMKWIYIYILIYIYPGLSILVCDSCRNGIA